MIPGGAEAQSKNAQLAKRALRQVRRGGYLRKVKILLARIFLKEKREDGIKKGRGQQEKLKLEWGNQSDQEKGSSAHSLSEGRPPSKSSKEEPRRR